MPPLLPPPHFPSLSLLCSSPYPSPGPTCTPPPPCSPAWGSWEAKSWGAGVLPSHVMDTYWSLLSYIIELVVVVVLDWLVVLAVVQVLVLVVLDRLVEVVVVRVLVVVLLVVGVMDGPHSLPFRGEIL